MEQNDTAILGPSAADSGRLSSLNHYGIGKALFRVTEQILKYAVSFAVELFQVFGLERALRCLTRNKRCKEIVL